LFAGNFAGTDEGDGCTGKTGVLFLPEWQDID
jgi:hypothetical protein